MFPVLRPVVCVAMSEGEPVSTHDHSREVLRFIPPTLIAVVTLWLATGLAALALGEPISELEQRMIQTVRDPTDPERMRGPRGLEEAMRDFTALGGYAVLGTTMLGFAVVLILHPAFGNVWFFLMTCLPAYGVGMLLKMLVNRSRPAIVPHLSHVGSSSFPSVHSMMSAVTYLTIGLMLSQHVDSRSLRRHLFILPLCLTLLVGVSRVCMGVHYPTDILAGWSAGLLWTYLVFRLGTAFHAT